jgi:hypothetical protein
MMRELGPKKTFTGFVQEKLVNAGSKSEHTAIVLHVDGVDYKLNVKGQNPFEQPNLKPFLGLRVAVEGQALDNHLFVANIKNITVLGPPGRTAQPRNPRPPQP